MPDTSPLVSVIIPCYNVADYIERALESVLPEVKSGFAQLICVDDCSTDSTRKKINDWINVHPEFGAVLLLQDNSGAPVARNTGINCSKGKWLKFLDADDILLPGMLRLQVQLAERENCSVLAGAYQVIDEKGKVVRNAQPLVGDVMVALMKTKFGITSSNLFLKDAVVSAGGWNTELKSSQEYDLMFSIAKSGGRLVSSSENFAVRLWREGSISTLRTAENWKRYCELRRKIYVHCKEQNGTTTHELDQAFFEAIRFTHPYHPELAMDCLKLLPKDFRVRKSDVVSSRYARIFRWFGFRFAQRLDRLLFHRL